MQHIAIRFDSKEGILGGSYMEPGIFGICEEGIRPPDLC